MKQFDTAIIVAGGKSTRMGFDKAFMKIGNTSCIELIIKKLKWHFNEIIVVTQEISKYNFIDVKTTHDEIKNAGPIGGLHAGLKISSSIYNYLIACDMPVLSDELIIHMKKLLSLRPDIISCKNNGFIEPFHAVYSKHLTTRIEVQIEGGEYSLFKLMLKSKTKIISDTKIKSICKSSNLFTNLNTRQELAQFTAEKVNN
ncbi:MAG TPA: molybdenum cofactor guanylyltransferase [Thermoanaerobacterales bacterium]|nr:molybdenum cofactor guanylyltransferase [Thermoanaerobacterales bacterium]